MGNLNKNKVGLTFCALVGGVHLIWSILVGFGWAQALVDFIFKLHMVKPVVVVDSFNFGLALALIIITAVIGYIVGYVFAFVWNKFHR